MATLPDVILEEERERVRPHVDRLKAFIRERDPDARFSFQVGHVPEFWELNAYVRPDLADDPDLGGEIAQLETDLLLDHDVAFSTILLERK